MFEFAAFCTSGPAEGPKNFGQHKINCLFLFMFSFLKVLKFRGGPALQAIGPLWDFCAPISMIVEL